MQGFGVHSIANSGDFLTRSHGFTGGNDLKPDIRILGKDIGRDFSTMSTTNDDGKNTVFIWNNGLAIANVRGVELGAASAGGVEFEKDGSGTGNGIT